MPPSAEVKLAALIEHTKLFEELFRGKKSFAIMKKHFKAYATGFDGAKDLRIRLMETENSAEVEHAIREFLKSA
jgi:tRNA-dihydrouridine synthase